MNPRPLLDAAVEEAMLGTTAGGGRGAAHDNRGLRQWDGAREKRHRMGRRTREGAGWDLDPRKRDRMRRRHESL